MNDDVLLNEDEMDCLKELMNISYGSATAAIAQIINKYATLNIPNIKTASIDEFKEYLHTKMDKTHSHFVTNQIINGTLSGEIMFIMDEVSTYNLSKEFDLDDDEIDEDELKDVILEISNIISSTTLSKLASLIGASMKFSPPTINIIKSIDDINNDYANEYKHIIIISTDINFKEQNIHGELLILSKDESILYIKNELNRLLDEL